MLKANYLVIPVESAIAAFWKGKFPDLIDLFDGNNLQITILPSSYRPIWGTASSVNQGYSSKYIDSQTHELEGFDVTLNSECNCASVYYLLKDLEAMSKLAPCGSFTGITVNDYLLPDLESIKADLEFTTRQTLLEVEQTSGSMGVSGDRSFFGTKLMFSILT